MRARVFFLCLALLLCKGLQPPEHQGGVPQPDPVPVERNLLDELNAVGDGNADVVVPETVWHDASEFAINVLHAGHTPVHPSVYESAAHTPPTHFSSVSMPPASASGWVYSPTGPSVNGWEPVSWSEHEENTPPDATAYVSVVPATASDKYQTAPDESDAVPEAMHTEAISAPPMTGIIAPICGQNDVPGSLYHVPENAVFPDGRHMFTQPCPVYPPPSAYHAGGAVAGNAAGYFEHICDGLEQFTGQQQVAQQVASGVLQQPVENLQSSVPEEGDPGPESSRAYEERKARQMERAMAGRRAFRRGVMDPPDYSRVQLADGMLVGPQDFEPLDEVEGDLDVFSLFIQLVRANVTCSCGRLLDGSDFQQRELLYIIVGQDVLLLTEADFVRIVMDNYHILCRWVFGVVHGQYRDGLPFFTNHVLQQIVRRLSSFAHVILINPRTGMPYALRDSNLFVGGSDRSLLYAFNDARRSTLRLAVSMPEFQDIVLHGINLAHRQHVLFTRLFPQQMNAPPPDLPAVPPRPSLVEHVDMSIVPDTPEPVPRNERHSAYAYSQQTDMDFEIEAAIQAAHEFQQHEEAEHAAMLQEIADAVPDDLPLPPHLMPSVSGPLDEGMLSADENGFGSVGSSDEWPQQGTPDAAMGDAYAS